MDDQVFQLIVSRFDKLESKVDELVTFKWKVYGMTVVISAVLGVAVQLVIAYLTK